VTYGKYITIEIFSIKIIKLLKKATSNIKI
jgi:hypothetical protein